MARPSDEMTKDSPIASHSSNDPASPPRSKPQSSSALSNGPAHAAPRASVARKRVWQEWPGNQVFLADGRIVLNNKWYGVLGTILLLFALEGVFLGIVAWRLKPVGRVLAYIAGLLLTVATCTFAVLTCITDPGMLPRMPPSMAYLRRMLPRTRAVPYRNGTITCTYDDTYHLYRPPRAHHCRVSDVVVDRFDHFCPWMGNTIGARNYRWFLLFLLLASVQVLATLALCGLHVAEHVKQAQRENAESESETFADDALEPADDTSVASALVDVIGTPILFCVVAIVGLAVIGLFLFHLKLVADGHTTYEHLENHGNIYSEGWRQNCRNAWCQPVPPPYVDFHQPIEDAEVAEPPEIVRMCNPPWANANRV